MKHLFFVGVLLLSAAACGQSPILHHHTADPAAKTTPRDTSILKFPTQGLVARLSWLKGPGTKGESVARLQFVSETTAEAVELKEKPAVTLWMPAMGHGSSPTSVSAAKDDSGEDQPGTFDVGNCYFIMPGEWEVQVRVGAETATLNVEL